MDVEQVEAALVEHYPRLVRLSYLVLPPGLGRSRRVLTAHALVQRALPRGRKHAPVIPAQSPGRDTDPGYAYLRAGVLGTALEAARPRKGLSRLSQLPPSLPQVWGLRLFPRSGGADELALDQRLSALSGPARAAYVLRDLEKLSDAGVRELLGAAGVADPDGALASANSVPAQPGLLASPEFDPCSLQARPTDLMRRRQHIWAALAAAAALAVCGALVALPEGGWGPDGAAAPVYAENPAAEAALDPGRLTRVSPTAWRTSARTDFSVWPARGPLTGDKALLRRALAVWARPGEQVRVSATPGTQTGGPAGPPQLLYAGEVDAARVVILYDGLRITRYAEPRNGTQGAALDFARTDGGADTGAGALVLGRSDGNVRYLLAPWVTKAAQRDLAKPDSAAAPLTVADGVTAPPAQLRHAARHLHLVVRAAADRRLRHPARHRPRRAGPGPPHGRPPRRAPGGVGHGGAAHLGAVRLLAGGRPLGGCPRRQRLDLRAAAAARRHRVRRVGVHPGGDLARCRHGDPGPLRHSGRGGRGGRRQGHGRAGLRAA
ncbi:hypothetical protein GCM10017687_22120 [Streptomyces echinatus]